MAGRRPLIDGSSGAPFQPDPHRPLTRHGAAPPNMIQSALLLPSCQLCKLVAGLPSLAARGYFGGDLPRCRCWHLSCCWRQRSVYLKPIHNCQCIRACRQVCQGIYTRELCDPSSTLGRAEADKLLSLPFDDSLRGTRCAALYTLLQCLAQHEHCCMFSPLVALVWQAVAVDLSLAAGSRGGGR